MFARCLVNSKFKRIILRSKALDWATACYRKLRDIFDNAPEVFMKIALILPLEYSFKDAYSILTQTVACLLPLISVGILTVEKNYE